MLWFIHCQGNEIGVNGWTLPPGGTACSDNLTQFYFQDAWIDSDFISAAGGTFPGILIDPRRDKVIDGLDGAFADGRVRLQPHGPRRPKVRHALMGVIATRKPAIHDPTGFGVAWAFGVAGGCNASTVADYYVIVENNQNAFSTQVTGLRIDFDTSQGDPAHPTASVAIASPGSLAGNSILAGKDVKAVLIGTAKFFVNGQEISETNPLLPGAT